MEREMIQKALRRHLGKITPTAAELGVSMPTLYDLMGNPEKSLAISQNNRGAFVLPAVESADLTGGNHQSVVIKAFTADTPGRNGIQDASFVGAGDGRKLERGEVLRKLSGIHLSFGTKQMNGKLGRGFIIFMNILQSLTA